MGIGEIVWIEIVSLKKVTGLTAAYNFIPNGDTLVDISGNGHNGKIVNCVREKDGLRTRYKLNRSIDYVSLSDIG